MTSFADKVEFDDVFAVAQTASDLLCEIEGKRVRIPQSQIDDDSEVWRLEDEGTLIISRWIAEQKGLV